MKKAIYFAALLLCTTFVGCEKDEIGDTATVNTAGQWYVTYNIASENGNVISDPYALGKMLLLTYNSAANNPAEMIVDDLGNFWEFKVKVNCDQQGLTFQTNTNENNNLIQDYEDINVSISGGKIMPLAGRQNNGSPADSIVFYVTFSDDDDNVKYMVSGIRYSGLEEND